MGVTNASLVDARIVQTFGSVLTANPTAYFTAYHATCEAQFFDHEAKAFLMRNSRKRSFALSLACGGERSEGRACLCDARRRVVRVLAS
jgi:hypothetical protein